MWPHSLQDIKGRPFKNFPWAVFRHPRPSHPSKPLHRSLQSMRSYVCSASPWPNSPCPHLHESVPIQGNSLTWLSAGHRRQGPRERGPSRFGPDNNGASYNIMEKEKPSPAHKPRGKKRRTHSTNEVQALPKAAQDSGSPQAKACSARRPTGTPRATSQDINFTWQWISCRGFHALRATSINRRLLRTRGVLAHVAVSDWCEEPPPLGFGPGHKGAAVMCTISSLGYALSRS